MTFVLLAGCPEARPCTTCPEVDGVYAVRWGSSDGGIAGSDGGACSATGQRDPSWVFAQQGSRVTTQAAGANLGGTLYDTYDLVLSGSEASSSYRLRALVIPEGTSLDAGIRLQGSFTTRIIPTGGEPCEVNEPFSAQRTSR